MKRAIAAHHEKGIREYVLRATRSSGDERRDIALELVGYLSASFGVCCYCGAKAEPTHTCEGRVRMDALLGRQLAGAFREGQPA